MGWCHGDFLLASPSAQLLPQGARSPGSSWPPRRAFPCAPGMLRGGRAAAPSRVSRAPPSRAVELAPPLPLSPASCGPSAGLFMPWAPQRVDDRIGLDLQNNFWQGGRVAMGFRLLICLLLSLGGPSAPGFGAFGRCPGRLLRQGGRGCGPFHPRGRPPAVGPRGEGRAGDWGPTDARVRAERRKTQKHNLRNLHDHLFQLSTLLKYL